MKKARRVLLSIIATISLSLALACGPSESDSSKTEKQNAGPEQESPKTVIGVSLLTRTHPFYQALEAAMRAEAEKRGFELLVQTGENDAARQKDQVADFLVKKVNAIILCPCDAYSIGESIAEANRAGIPVFTADTACLAEGARVECHIASDNRAGGREAGKAMIEALGGAGQVAIIDHPEVESVIERVKGFEEEIAKAAGIKIVSKLPAGGTKDAAFRVAEDILQAHPGLAGIFGINDDSALGAVVAVEKAGKSGKIAIVGFDAVPEARKAIEAGKIYADVIQQPELIGAKTIEVIAQYMAGEKIPASIQIPCGLFKKGDGAANK